MLLDQEEAAATEDAACVTGKRKREREIGGGCLCRRRCYYCNRDAADNVFNINNSGQQSSAK